MKKIMAAKTFMVSALLCSSTFALAPANHQYSSTMHPAQNILANMLHPPTDITVVNASSDYLYAVVPNSPVNDYLQPGYNDHIYNYDPNIYSTYLVLQDPYRRTFYSNMVCRLAIVTVYGYAGHYSVNTDSDLCN